MNWTSLLVACLQESSPLRSSDLRLFFATSASAPMPRPTANPVKRGRQGEERERARSSISKWMRERCDHLYMLYHPNTQIRELNNTCMPQYTELYHLKAEKLTAHRISAVIYAYKIPWLKQPDFCDRLILQFHANPPSTASFHSLWHKAALISR